MYLYNHDEKELWRQSAVAAIQTVENVKLKDDKELVQFAVLVADNIVRKYRQRLEEKESA